MEGEEGGGSCDDHHQLLHDHLIMSEDVLIQILLCLPVISLLRFKSVCKSWRSIIQSRFFIHLHATTKLGGGSSSSSSINLGVHVNKGNILTLSGGEFEFFENLVIPAALLEYLSGDEMFEVLLKGLWDDCVNLLMVGCCDGIICLHDYFTRNVALWNPAIKQSRFLPKPSNLLGFSRCFSKMFINDDDGYISEDFVRFGIDIKTNNYKVLLITNFKLRSNDYGSDLEGEEDKVLFRSESPHERRVHVYSLSTDSWKCLDDATLSAAHPDDLDIYIKTHHNQGLYLNGSYFFTAIYYNEDDDMALLLSFDFTEEIFRTIQPPFDLRDKNNISGYLYFISFGESVALIYANDCIEYEYDIWVLNHEQHSGMKESWTKFYTIGPPDKLPNEPLFITNNGEFVITYGWYWQDDRVQDVSKLQLLNLITGEKKLLRCECESLSTDIVYVYKPSLMPIGGNAAAST